MVVMLHGIDLDTLYQHHQLKMCIGVKMVQQLHSFLIEHQIQVMTMFVGIMAKSILSTFTHQIVSQRQLFQMQLMYFKSLADTLKIPKMMSLIKDQETINFTVSRGSGKYVTRYDRLDLGVPVEVGHLVGGQVSLSVVPGGLYRVKVWSINGQQISSKPKEATYRAKSSGMYCSIVN